MCQYEENVGVYLDAIKKIYKDLITVGKDSDTGEIKIHSFVFEIENVDGVTSLWPTKDHP